MEDLVASSIQQVRRAQDLCAPLEWGALGHALDDRLVRLEAVLRRLRLPREARPRVAIVGDANVGKSTLLNTLLGAPWGGVPASAQAGSTRSSIVLKHGEGVRVSRVLSGPDNESFDAELPAEADAQDSTRRGWLRDTITAAHAAGAHNVVVECPAAVLRHATLIDSCGTNTPGHEDVNSIVDALSEADLCVVVTRDSGNVMSRTTLEICEYACRRLGDMPLMVLVNVQEKADADAAVAAQLDATTDPHAEVMRHLVESSLKAIGKRGVSIFVANLRKEMYRVFGVPPDDVDEDEPEPVAVVYGSAAFEQLGVGGLMTAVGLISRSPLLWSSRETAAHVAVSSTVRLLQAIMDERVTADTRVREGLLHVTTARNMLDEIKTELYHSVDDFIFEHVLTGDSNSPFTHRLDSTTPNAVLEDWWSRLPDVEAAAFSRVQMKVNAVNETLVPLLKTARVQFVPISIAPMGHGLGDALLGIVEEARRDAGNQQDTTLARTKMCSLFACACDAHAQRQTLAILAPAQLAVGQLEGIVRCASHTMPDGGNGACFEPVLQSLSAIENDVRELVRAVRYPAVADDEFGWLGASFSAHHKTALAPLLDVMSQSRAALTQETPLTADSNPSAGGSGASAHGQPPAEEPSPLRILSMDGGGVRGSMIVSQLIHIEEQARAQARADGIPDSELPTILDLFDVICGTSAGGLVALALVYGGRNGQRMCLAELQRVFDEEARRIFPPDRLPLIGRSITSGLKGVICRLVGDSQYLLDRRAGTPFPHSRCRVPHVFVTSTRMHCKSGNAVGFIFRNYESTASRYAGTSEDRVYLAARCTSAAPTYFDLPKKDDFVFVDGGLGNNNPTSVALLEARALWPHRPIGVVVSLGTGHMPPPKHIGAGMRMGQVLAFDLTTALKIALDTSTSSSTTNATLLSILKDLPDTSYFRLNPVVNGIIELDDVSQLAMTVMRNAVKDFFKQPFAKRRIERIASLLLRFR